VPSALSTVHIMVQRWQLAGEEWLTGSELAHSLTCFHCNRIAYVKNRKFVKVLPQNFINKMLKSKELVYLVGGGVSHYTCCFPLSPSPSFFNLCLWNIEQYCCLDFAIVCSVCICLVLSLKQKCSDTLSAMQCKMRYVTDLDIAKKTEVTTAIKNWEEYCVSITEHEVQFRVCV
jgi:hypothetical protein